MKLEEVKNFLMLIEGMTQRVPPAFAGKTSVPGNDKVGVRRNGKFGDLFGKKYPK